MQPSAGLVTALNKMREMSVQDGSVYHQYIPVIDQNTDISKFGQPILDSNLQPVYNEFFHLLKRIAFVAINTKNFRNPLTQLEGDNLPLGYAGENIYANPAAATQFNVNDFAGLLQKYEARVAVEYLTVNTDLQYKVTLTREKIRTAFTSWGELESFINGIINTLYNGAAIDSYRLTKNLVPAAFKDGRVQYEIVDYPNTTAKGEAFVKHCRKLYTNFQLPSTKYNAWKKYGGKDAEAITTWSNPEDIFVMIRSDVDSEISVSVLAKAFNMNETDFISRVIVVDDFDLYDNEGTKIFDGSAILGGIFDKSFFKIRVQDYAMDEFYNCNNRSWQYMLNKTSLYATSLFANGVVLATEAPAESGESGESK